MAGRYPMTKLAQAQKAVGDATQQLRRCEKRALDGKDALARLPMLEAELSSAQAALDREQRVVDTEHVAELTGEFDALLIQLDKAWTQAGENRVTEILAAFRCARDLNGHPRSGQSSEALRRWLEDKKTPHMPAHRRYRWQDLRQWIRREQTERAA